MKFFHAYDSRGFDGLVKNDLINEDTGFKIQHVYSMPSNFKFNRVAAKGSTLHSLLKEGNYPFYVDRLTGGLRYHPYIFDRKLIEEYRSMLGDWFLGFQQHELMGRAADWRRIGAMLEKEPDCDPRSTLQLQKLLFTPEYLPPDGTPMYFLTQGAPEEYSGLPMPHDPESCLADAEWLIRRRMEQTDGMLLFCCSGHMMFPVANRLGGRAFMPELGAQTPHARIAVALTRGLARTNNKMWGTYYECWRRNKPLGDTFGYTKPVYDPNSINEWWYTQDQFVDDFTTGGPTAGSSRLLQRRIYFYSLMSGAQFLSEEWEMNCTYESTSTLELSPYGLLKKEFIEFALGHKQMETKTPFAIVLPTDYEDIQLFSFARTTPGEPAPSYLTFPISGERAVRVGRIQDLLNFIFRRDLEHEVGNESHTLQNSRFGDLFDIVYADVSDEVLARYDRLVDADPDGTFARKMAGKRNVLTSEDFDTLEIQLKARAAEILPITVDALHWLLSEDENGRYLTVFNNEGNTRILGEGDFVDHRADVSTAVHTKPGISLDILYASSDQVRVEKRGEGEYSVFVPATDLVILRY